MCVAARTVQTCSAWACCIDAGTYAHLLSAGMWTLGMQLHVAVALIVAFFSASRALVLAIITLPVVTAAVFGQAAA
jgi:hypothetical protein